VAVTPSTPLEKIKSLQFNNAKEGKQIKTHSNSQNYQYGTKENGKSKG